MRFLSFRLEQIDGCHATFQFPRSVLSTPARKYVRKARRTLLLGVLSPTNRPTFLASANVASLVTHILNAFAS